MKSVLVVSLLFYESYMVQYRNLLLFCIGRFFDTFLSGAFLHTGNA